MVRLFGRLRRFLLAPRCLATAVLVGAGILMITMVAGFWTSQVSSMILLGLAVAVFIVALEAVWSVALCVLYLWRTPPSKVTERAGVNGPSIEAVVAIPLLISSRSVIERAVTQIRELARSNQNGSFIFCLLCDLPDTLTDTSVLEHQLVRELRLHVEQLSASFGDDMLMLYRDRIWVQGDGNWSAREKKRGKIEDLVHLMVSGDASPFSLKVGCTDKIKGIRHLITLDADTEIEAGGLRRLVEAMLVHEASSEYGSRTVGSARCGVLQPIPYVRIPSDATAWQFLYGTEEPVRENAYQDLYERGSFYGKGIISARAYHEVLKDRFPPNLVLSHDLLEGEYLESQITYDVSVIEVHPRTYAAGVARRHRWIRGDWQSSPWLLPTVATGKGRASNPLRLLSKIKIAENMARSLVPPAMLISVFAGVWLGGGWAWIILLLGVRASPILVPLLIQVMVRGRMPSVPTLVGALKSSTVRAMNFALLPYEARIHVDAIVKALYRMAISRKKLLEWVPASDSTGGEGFMVYLRTVGVSAASACLLLLVLSPHEDMRLVALICGAWLAGPALCYILDGPIPRRSSSIGIP